MLNRGISRSLVVLLATIRADTSTAFVHTSRNAIHQHRRLASSSFPSALHLSASSTRTKGKDREKELQQLGANLKMDVSQLQQVLKQKRSEMKDNSEKAKYIDWLLRREPTSPPTSSPTSSPKKSSPKKQGERQKQDSFLTSDLFADQKDLHPASKRALAELFQITSMTEIQSKTFAAASSGKDVLGRARTGTGKT